MRKLMRTVTSAAAGATAAYYLDPISGRGRRTRLRDQVTAKVRRAGRELQKKARYETGRLKGKVYEVTGKGANPPSDVTTMIQKIRSEVLGPAGLISKDVEIDFELESGEVVLRGLEEDKMIWEDLEGQIRSIAGVETVRTAPRANSFGV